MSNMTTTRVTNKTTARMTARVCTLKVNRSRDVVVYRVGLFCKRALQKRRYSAKETYNFKEPTHLSHLRQWVACFCAGVSFTPTSGTRRCKLVHLYTKERVHTCTRKHTRANTQHTHIHLRKHIRANTQHTHIHLHNPIKEAHLLYEEAYLLPPYSNLRYTEV